MLFSSVVLAQKKVLHGKITNDKEVEGIHILNTTSRFNAITNELGNFSINVNKNDTLVFSSINFFPEKVLVSEEIYEKGVLVLALREFINELDEVVLGTNLSGNIDTDLKSIKTDKPMNFEDVGIPGFKGKPEEKIVPLAYAVIPTSVNLEALYNHISGYYRKLRLRRKWEAQNTAVAHIINYYGSRFFTEAYNIPQDRVYDFVLFCVETTSIQTDFKKANFAGALATLESKSIIYKERLNEDD